MSRLERAWLRLGDAEARVAALCLVAMVLLIFAGALARLAGTPLNWSTDAATALFAWACFLCADLAWRRDGLMSVDLVTRRLPPAWAAACVLANRVLIALFLGWLVVQGTWLAWTSRARSFQGLPEVSYSWVTAALPVGAALLLATTLFKLRGARPPGAA